MVPRMAIPPSARMSQAAMLGQLIAVRLAVVPEFSGVHETPAFDVRKTCPPSAVAKHVVVPEHPKPKSVTLLEGVRSVQLLPPSVVTKICGGLPRILLPTIAMVKQTSLLGHRMKL
jgi:hypothetical protein